MNFHKKGYSQDIVVGYSYGVSTSICGIVLISYISSAP